VDDVWFDAGAPAIHHIDLPHRHGENNVLCTMIVETMVRPDNERAQAAKRDAYKEADG